MHRTGAAVIIVADMARPEASEVEVPSREAESGLYMAACSGVADAGIEILRDVRECRLLGRPTGSTDRRSAVTALPHTGARSHPPRGLRGEVGERVPQHGYTDYGSDFYPQVYRDSTVPDALEVRPHLRRALLADRETEESASVRCFASGERR